MLYQYIRNLADPNDLDESERPQLEILFNTIRPSPESIDWQTVVRAVSDGHSDSSIASGE